ncbi:MAG TPA: transposase, partial [Aquificales bacterium]|nr:transposase [Aquificales bacterium]
YLSHLLNGGGKARSVVRVGTSLKSPSTEGRNLSGVPKATATFCYISSLLSTF